MDKKISKDDNPCDLVDKKKFVKFYNKDKKKPEDRVISIVETEQLLNKIHNEIKERPSSLYPYGVQLSLLTGMRVGEICGLRWENVLDDRIVICESEKYNQSTKRYYQSDTKTDKERTLPITDDLRKFFKTMKSLQTKYGSDKDFVISTANGKLHTRNLSDYMIKSSKKLGFNVSKGIHTIRRTFNSYMRQSGISAVMAGSIIGNTAEVNNNHYTYDICDMKTKKELVSKIEDKMILRFAHDAHEEIQ
jgi:integrase